MRMRRSTSLGRSWIVVAWSCGVLACGSDDDPSESSEKGGSRRSMADGAVSERDSAADGAAAESGEAAAAEACPAFVDDADCDRTKRPLVFIHGTTGNGENFSHPALLLASNGYCADRIVAVEYHSLVPLPCPDGAASCQFMLDREETYRRAKAAVDEAIEKLRADTGSEQVDLLGHSQGAGHGSRYARENPDKVARYVHLAGQELESDPGGVPTLCLSSTGDAPRACKTTKNVVFEDDTLDHVAVSSSTEAFVAIYEFLNDGATPRHDTVQCGNPILIEGRAPTFGDNTFLERAEIDVFELGENPFQRGAPVRNFELGPDGRFGPFEATRGVTYEFKLVAPPGDMRRPRHAYMQPFTRSDRLVRLNFESTDPVASATGKQINFDNSHSVIVVRRRQKAFLFGRDSLRVDGFEVLNEVNAKRGSAIVGLYLYDESSTPEPGPGDGMSSGESIISGAFVNSADVYISTEDIRFLEIDFGGTMTKVQNWPSGRQGMSLVLVD